MSLCDAHISEDRQISGMESSQDQHRNFTPKDGNCNSVLQTHTSQTNVFPKGTASGGDGK